MGAAAADFDNDGWPDIYVACDSAPSLLYRNNHDGTFREIAVPAGCALDENGVARQAWEWPWVTSMADGWLDIVRTNFSDQVTTLIPQLRERSFRRCQHQGRAGREPQVSRLRRGLLRLRTMMAGRTCFIANGHVYSQITEQEAACLLQRT